MALEMLHADQNALFSQSRVDANAQSELSPLQLQGLHSGDSACWERLLSRMEKRCLALAWRILNDSHLAADAVQNGFLSAYRARTTLRSTVQVDRWLLATVANAARDVARSRLRTDVAMAELKANVPGPGSTKTAAHVAEDELQFALAQLDEKSRLTFLLVHQEGFSYQDVAVDFGWPIGTVRSTLHRARQRLREILREREVLKP